MNVIELAKQAGYQHLPTVRLAYSGFNLERFATLVRAAALEEAAQECEEKQTSALDYQSWDEACQDCADAIRALRN